MAIVFLLNPIFSAIFNSNHTKMMKALIIGYLSIEKLSVWYSLSFCVWEYMY